VSKPVLAIVIGSTRPGRVGPKFAAWFRSRAIEHGGFEVELVDLAALKLPFLDEPGFPRLHQYVHEHTIIGPDRRALRRVRLRHARIQLRLQRGTQERDRLPVAGVGRQAGRLSELRSVAAGTRAVQQLKQVVTALKMIPIAESVNIPFFSQFIDDSGTVRPNDLMTRSPTRCSMSWFE